MEKPVYCGIFKNFQQVAQSSTCGLRGSGDNCALGSAGKEYGSAANYEDSGQDVDEITVAASNVK